MIEAGGEEVTSRGYVAQKRESQAQVNLDTKLPTNSTQHTRAHMYVHTQRSNDYLFLEVNALSQF